MGDTGWGSGGRAAGGRTSAGTCPRTCFMYPSGFGVALGPPVSCSLCPPGPQQPSRPCIPPLCRRENSQRRQTNTCKIRDEEWNCEEIDRSVCTPPARWPNECNILSSAALTRRLRRPLDVSARCCVHLGRLRVAPRLPAPPRGSITSVRPQLPAPHHLSLWLRTHSGHQAGWRRRRARGSPPRYGDGAGRRGADAGHGDHQHMSQPHATSDIALRRLPTAAPSGARART